MKKYVLFFIIILLISGSCIAQGFKITAKISKAKPQKATLAYYFEDKQYVAVDSGKIENNSFVFTGKKNLPSGIYCVILKDDSQYFDLLIDPENQNFTLKADISDIQKTMKFYGSQLNNDFYDYQRLMTKIIVRRNELDTLKKYETDSTKIPQIDEKLDKIDQEIDNAWKTTAKEHAGTFLADVLNCMNASNYAGTEMFKYINFAQPGLLRTPFFYNKIRTHIARHIESGAWNINYETDRIINLAAANEDVYHYVTSYLLNFYRTFYKYGINEVFIHIADTYFLPDTVKNLNPESRNAIKEQRDIYNASMPGQIFKDIKLANTYTGDSIKLSQTTPKAKLLLFWANGCGHCDSAENALKFYYNDLKKRNIEVISICNDNFSREGIKQNAERKNFPWNDYCDVKNYSRYREYYYVVSTPLLFFIDKNGKIVQKTAGEDNITRIAKQLSGHDE